MKHQRKYFKVKEHTDGVHIIKWKDGNMSIGIGIIEKGYLKTCYAVLTPEKKKELVNFLKVPFGRRRK